jgi:hypothetical protein
MRRTIVSKSSLVLALGLLSFSGCNAYRLEPPSGFAEVDADRRAAHYKAGDDAGLSVRVYDNVEGGTLAFWSEDLVRKLGERSYELVAQEPVESANGRPGTEFHFAYETPDGQRKFYSAALFVTDRYRFVMQLAGDEELGDKYRPRLDAIAGAMKVRGCRAGGNLCDGPQPRPLLAPGPEPEQTDPLASGDSDDDSSDGAG